MQGKTLDTPERVPFRLTQNLVDGLGVTGVEGKDQSSFCSSKGFTYSPIYRCIQDCERDYNAAPSRKQGCSHERIGRLHPRPPCRMGGREKEKGRAPIRFPMNVPSFNASSPGAASSQ